MDTRRKLTRSRTDRMLGGVCGGLAEYLGIDSVWVRLFFVLLLFGQGVGFWVYLILWIIMPGEEAGQIAARETVQANVREMGDRARNIGSEIRESFSGERSTQTGIIIGSALIILGGIYLLENLGIPWLSWLRFNLIWPVLLILAGVALIFRRARD